MNRGVIALSLILFFVGVFAKEAISMETLKSKKIVMIISHSNFRDEELNVPLAIFQNRGADVKVASTSVDIATGKLGAKIKPDLLYSDIDPKDFDAVVFVGGPGSVGYWEDPTAHKIARNMTAQGKVIAAICGAPPTLANAGVLKGKKATCCPGDEEPLIENGATYTAKNVQVDGNIVTADGPQSAKLFAEEITKLLVK